jgi:hypothetical protein
MFDEDYYKEEGPVNYSESILTCFIVDSNVLFAWLLLIVSFLHYFSSEGVEFCFISSIIYSYFLLLFLASWILSIIEQLKLLVDLSLVLEVSDEPLPPLNYPLLGLEICTAPLPWYRGDSLLISLEDRHEISATYTSSAKRTLWRGCYS